MQSSMLKAIVEDFGNGGTIDGDLVITGDLQVSGGGSLSFDEIIEGTQVIDVTSTEALLVRKNGDGGDVLIVDTTNEDVAIGGTLAVVTTTNSDVTVANFQSAIDANGEHSLIRVGHGSKAAYMGLLLNSADTAYFGIDDNPDDGNGIYVNESGNVGIGGTPINQFSIIGDAAIKNINIYTNSDAAVTSDTGARIFTTGDGGSGIYGENGHLVIQGRAAGRDTVFLTGASATERMRIASDGKIYMSNSKLSIGDGDDPGNYSLYIKEEGSVGDFVARIDNTHATSGHGLRIRAGDSSTESVLLLEDKDGTDAANFKANGDAIFAGNVQVEDKLTLNRTGTGANSWDMFVSHYGSSDYGSLFVDSNESTGNFYIRDSSDNVDFVVTGAGNVGIGTSSPTTVATKGVEIVNTTASSATEGGELRLTSNDGAAQGSGHRLGGISFAGYEDSGSTKITGASIEAFAEQAWSGSQNSSYLSFKTNQDDNSFAERMRIASSGLVTFAGAIAVSDNIQHNGDADNQIEFTTDVQKYYTAGVARMVINAAGNVLIGHTAAIDVGQTGSFQVNGTDNDSGSMSVVNWGNNSAHFAQIHLAHSKSNAKGTNTTLADNDAIGGIFFRGADGSDFETISASIVSNVDGSVATSRVPADLIFSTAAGSSDDDVAERMRITSSGDVGIGGTPNGEANLLVHSGDANASSIYITNTDTGIGDTSGLVVGIENDEGGKINKFGSGSFLRLGTNGVHRMILDDNSRISLSNNDAGDRNTVFGYDAGLSMHASSTDNTFIGHRVSDATMTATADYNTAVGGESMSALTSGNGNTAVGYGSMTSNSQGNNNTGIGVNSLTNVSTTHNNTALGLNAGNYTQGADNTYVGYYAGKGAAGADASNVGVGANALLAITEGTSNTALGKDSMKALTTGERNTAIGTNSLQTLASGGTPNLGNVAVGYAALGVLQTGMSNVAIGVAAMDAANGAISNCVVIGDRAGDAINNTGANGTVALGYHALGALTSGTGNVAVGNNALLTEDDGTHSTAIGYESLKDLNSANYNTAVGSQSGANLTSGSSNTIMGQEALTTALTAAENVSIGYRSMFLAEGGESQNVAIGVNSMKNVQEGSGGGDADYNIAIGYNALLGGDFAGADLQLRGNIAIGGNAMIATAANAQTGTIAIGESALADLTSGGSNTAIGFEAGTNVTTGGLNTFVGYLSGHGLDGSAPLAGAYNTCLGEESGYLLQGAAHSNTCIGQGAGDVITTGTTNTLVGRGADPSSATGVNQTVIGSTATGQQNNSVTLGNAAVTAVYMSSDGATGTGATIYGKAFEMASNSGGGSPVSKMMNHVADAEGATFQFVKSRNTTVGSHTIVANNDELGLLTWYASDGNSFEKAAQIKCMIDGTPGDGDLPTEMLFGVSADGAASPTTRMTIAPAGTVSGDFNDTSDVGLKENIKSIGDGLSIVKQMNPVSFDWRQKSRGSNSGFIAQEIEKLLPNDVNGEDYIIPEDGEDAENMGKSINVTGIVAHLVKAVQELTAKVEALEKK